jgi:N-acetylglutamate synthase
MKTSIRELETLSFRAWPALESRFYDGWLLRFSEGYTRRANSVNPVYGHSADLEHKVAQCEAFYVHKDLNPCFKMTDAVLPADLDDYLAHHGYTRDAPTSVQTIALDQADTVHDHPVVINTQLSERWLADFAQLNGVDGRYMLSMRQMLRCIVPQTCYISLEEGGRAVAVGLGVLDDSTIGLFDIVIAPYRRRQGLGLALVKSLLHWGKTNGAQQAYLQVMADNVPALQLYRKVGFREVYQYWYRIKSVV